MKATPPVRRQIVGGEGATELGHRFNVALATDGRLLIECEILICILQLGRLSEEVLLVRHGGRIESLVRGEAIRDVVYLQHIE